MRVRQSLSIIALAVLAITSASAANQSLINRYITVKNKAMPEQINPLLAIQQIHFPQTIKTVGDAMHYWLRHSGYRLADFAKQPNALKQVFDKPLPQTQRTLGPIRVIDGLEVIAGQPAFSITQDLITREINLHTKNETLHQQEKKHDKALA